MVVLTGVVAAEHVLVTAHETVLDPTFVTTSLDDSGAYEASTSLGMAYATGAISNQSSAAGDEFGPTAEAGTTFVADAAASAVLDPDYVQAQVEPNVFATYQYLHGSADEPVLVVDTRPAKDAFITSVETELTSKSLGDLLVSFRVDEQLTEAGIPVDEETLLRIDGTPEDYAAAQDGVRTAVREGLVLASVVEAMQHESTDSLLALAIDDYDPNAYTDDEKADLLVVHESAIRAALYERAEQTAGKPKHVSAALSALNEQGHESVGVPEDLRESAGETGAEAIETLQHIYVDALTGDLSHAAYQRAVDDVHDDLALALTAEFGTMLDEYLPDEMVLTEELSPEAETAFVDARQVVTTLDLLALALPLVGALIFGAIWRLARAFEVALFAGGSSALFVGAVSYFGSMRATAELNAMLAEQTIPPEFLSVVQSLLDAVFVVFVDQSVVLVVAGAACILSSAALRVSGSLAVAPDLTDGTAE